MFAGLLKTRAFSKRHYGLVMAFAIVLVAGLFIVEPYIKASLADPVIIEDKPAVESIAQFFRSAPVRLVIPKLNLDTSFVAPLGLQPDQTVSVPDSYTEVGWYEGGATPGENGPAVILGHVDSKEGPAVFYSLGQLKVSDEIEVTRSDGTIAVFVVDKLQRYPQSDFPTQAVYGPTDTPTLRLVTCTGTFDRGAQKYSHNLVVYAHLK